MRLWPDYEYSTCPLCPLCNLFFMKPCRNMYNLSLKIVKDFIFVLVHRSSKNREYLGHSNSQKNWMHTCKKSIHSPFRQKVHFPHLASCSFLDNRRAEKFLIWTMHKHTLYVTNQNLVPLSLGALQVTWTWFRIFWVPHNWSVKGFQM